MEISTLIGKQILSPTGELLGSIKNVCLSRDFTKISSYICFDDEEEEFFLSARSVSATGDAVIAGKARLSSPTGIPCPIGMTAYSNLGEHLGTICDLTRQENSADFILYKNGTKTNINADRVLIAETAIVYPTAQARKRASAPARVRKPTEKTANPKPEATTAVAEIRPEQPKHSAAPTEQPTEAPFGYRLNLLGKQVKKSVFDGQGYPIAITGEKVTPPILLCARKNNRLLELTVNTLTNIW